MTTNPKDGATITTLGVTPPPVGLASSPRATRTPPSLAGQELLEPDFVAAVSQQQAAQATARSEPHAVNPADILASQAAQLLNYPALGLSPTGVMRAGFGRLRFGGLLAVRDLPPVPADVWKHKKALLDELLKKNPPTRPDIQKWITEVWRQWVKWALEVLGKIEGGGKRDPNDPNKTDTPETAKLKLDILDPERDHITHKVIQAALTTLQGYGMSKGRGDEVGVDIMWALTEIALCTRSFESLPTFILDEAKKITPDGQDVPPEITAAADAVAKEIARVTRPK